jgi:outer membrane lipoprotein-sorting protein
MGMEMPLEMIMKNPNKIKVIYNFSGQQMISVFDGEKGYMMNPLTGSMDPVELKGEQLSQLTRNNVFNNEVMNSFDKKRLSYEGEEAVSGKPAYKLKITIEGSAPGYLFIDKSSGLLVKASTTVAQQGTTMNVETYLTDYKETKGLVFPMKTTAHANGMEAAVITFDLVEVNIPVEDSVFKVK